MAESNVFVIRGRLPSLNEYVSANRAHWSKGARLKADTEQMIVYAIKSAVNRGKCHKVTRPCWIEFIWCEYGARRDLDNVYSAKKYILDAMQKAGIIDNDDRKHIYGLSDRIAAANTKADERIVVYIHEDGEAGT